MNNFQNFIKTVRESKNIDISTVTSATNLSNEIIENIENANNDNLLMDSANILKTQIRRYCEYLEINEKDIISILNKIDILYYKKSNIGKLKTFDYINRLCIFILATIITIFIINLLKNSVLEIKGNKVDNSDENSIIYVPIDYTVDNTDSSNADINNSSTTVTKDKVVAHPPSQANMTTFVIEDDIPTETVIDNTNNKTNIDPQVINDTNDESIKTSDTQEINEVAKIDTSSEMNNSVITNISKSEIIEPDTDAKLASTDKSEIVEKNIPIDNSTSTLTNNKTETTNKNLKVESVDIQNETTSENNISQKVSEKSFWDIF